MAKPKSIKAPVQDKPKRRYIPRAERRKAAEEAEAAKDSLVSIPGLAPRTKGKQTNPVRLEAKAALLQAFEDMGGVKALVKWGKKNPTEFYRIWARLLPKDVNAGVIAMPLEELLRQLEDSAEAGATVDEAARQLGYMGSADNGSLAGAESLQ